MTTRLYYTDSYLSAFDARVVDRSDDGRRIYLDRTAFYPTSGGQPHDTGTMNGIAVRDVADDGDRVAHILDAPVESDTVSGVVDWSRRFDHMQQHTGQHLLSAVLATLFDWHTISVHFGSDISTLDLDVSSVAPERVAAAAERANTIVFENRPVRVSFEDAATATGLRKASDRSGTLRIVTIADLDRSACGGTHVRATGEIGPILIRRIDKVRQSARLEFVCGWRAIRGADADHAALASLGRTLSAAPNEVAELVAHQHDRLRDVEARGRALENELALRVARERYDAAQPDAMGVCLIVERRATGTLDELRPLALAVAAMPHALFVGMVASPVPGVLMASAADSGVDAGRVLKTALTHVGGRGGGSPRLAQGTVPASDELDAVVRGIAQQSSSGLGTLA